MYIYILYIVSSHHHLILFHLNVLNHHISSLHFFSAHSSSVTSLFFPSICSLPPTCFRATLSSSSFEALKRQFARKRTVGLMEQPEDLGRTRHDRLTGHQPASMWQFWQFEELLTLDGVQTVVFAQSEFGTSSPKPTRFLMRIFTPLRPAMHEGPPEFDEQGWYSGPLPRQSGGAPLIGKENGVFKTAHSAAWPPALCKWTAEAILTSFLQECLGGG